MSKSNYTILIAEGDNSTRVALAESLEAAGYRVISTIHGQATLNQFEAIDEIDLVILDRHLPQLTDSDLNGLQVCQKLRKNSNVPIIMTAVLGSPADRVTGLEMGANDYVVKPVSTQELIARIRSILRRVTHVNTRPDERPDERPNEKPDEIAREKAAPFTLTENILKVGKLTIDVNNRHAYRGSQQLRLTEIEFRLLALLANRPGHIFSRGDILVALWGYDASSASDTKTVDVHISRLRIKLNDRTQNPEFIVTIRGRGYLFLVQR